MVNFSPLTAEIGSLVWGTPANFNRLISYFLTNTCYGVYAVWFNKQALSRVKILL